MFSCKHILPQVIVQDFPVPAKQLETVKELT